MAVSGPDMAVLVPVSTGWSASGGTARLGRAATFASSSVCLAWAAHVAGGAQRSPATTMIIAFLLLTRIAYGLGGRERRLPMLVAGIAGTQVLLHITFALAHPHAHRAGGYPIEMRMVFAHGLAAVCVAVLLRRAERVLWSASGLRPHAVLFRLFRPVADRAVPSIPPVPRVDVRRRAPRPHTRPLGPSARRRGPPPGQPEFGRTGRCAVDCSPPLFAMA